MKDLFETPKKLPRKVQEILNTWDEEENLYNECARLENELKPLGYTFQWGLDGSPYNLRSIQDVINESIHKLNRMNVLMINSATDENKNLEELLKQRRTCTFKPVTRDNIKLDASRAA